MALAACALPAAVAPCAARELERDEPRLILPGARQVEPGEWIVLQWTPADSVRELELMLSLDGGRTWPVCISPSLAPERCTFRWQVPATATRDLRLRIRFNRGGREIEGAPSGPLQVTAGDRDEPLPLGLPGAAPDPARTVERGRPDPSAEERGSERLERPRDLASQQRRPTDGVRSDANRAGLLRATGNEPLRVPMRT